MGPAFYFSQQIRGLSSSSSVDSKSKSSSVDYMLFYGDNNSNKGSKEKVTTCYMNFKSRSSM